MGSGSAHSVSDALASAALDSAASDSAASDSAALASASASDSVALLPEASSELESPAELPPVWKSGSESEAASESEAPDSGSDDDITALYAV